MFMLLFVLDLLDLNQHNPFDIDSTQKRSLTTDTFRAKIVSNPRDAAGWKVHCQRCWPEINTWCNCVLSWCYIAQNKYHVDDTMQP